MNTRPRVISVQEAEELERRQRGDMIATSGGGGNHGGRSRTDKLIDSLLLAGIIALVTATIVSYVTAIKVETALIQRNDIYDREIRRIDGVNERQDARFEADETWLRRHEQRLDQLEQSGSPGQRDADDRPKRR